MIDAIQRLRAVAQEAIAAYGAETAGGGEPVFPQWAQDALDVCGLSSASTDAKEPVAAQPQGRKPTGDELRAIVKSLRGSSDGPSLTETAYAGWMAALSAQPVQDKPQEAGQAREEREAFERAMAQAITADQGKYAMSRAYDEQQSYTFLATRWAWTAWQARAGQAAQAVPDIADMALEAVAKSFDKFFASREMLDVEYIIGSVRSLKGGKWRSFAAAQSAPSVSADKPASAGDLPPADWLQEVAELNCPKAWGFEGPETFPDCGKCVVCRAHAEMNTPAAQSKGGTA